MCSLKSCQNILEVKKWTARVIKWLRNRQQKKVQTTETWEKRKTVSYSRPEQLRAQTPQFLNSLLKANMNFTQHNLINIQTHAYQHSRANTEGGARRGSCPFGVGITMEELCRGWRQHLPLPPPSAHRTWLERRLKACVPPVGSRLFIPIQLPHLHRVWLAASNLGAFPLLKADVCKQCRFSSPPELGDDTF